VILYISQGSVAKMWWGNDKYFIANSFQNTMVKELKNRPTFGKVINEKCRRFFMTHSVYAFAL